MMKSIDITITPVFNLVTGASNGNVKL